MAFSFIRRVPNHSQGLCALRDRLHVAITDAITNYLVSNSGSTIYSFALDVGQGGNFLGYQIMTEQLLSDVVEYHFNRGYRHKYTKDDDDEHRLRLREWLRWQNPDDDWFMSAFGEESEVQKMFQTLVYRDLAFENNEGGIFEFLCDDVLATLPLTDTWRNVPNCPSIALGVRADDLDFFTSFVRCNSFSHVITLWHEFFLGNELEGYISKLHDADSLPLDLG